LRLDPGLRRGDGKYLRWALVAFAGLLIALLMAHPAFAQAAAAPGTGPVNPATPGAVQASALNEALGQVSGDGKPLSLSLQILVLMSLLTVLPSLLLMMTSFTRIIIVLSLLRQALGLQQTPPNQVLVGLSLFLTLFIMRPVIDQVNQTAITPYGNGQIPLEEGIKRGGDALHVFMVHQVRKTDIELFQNIAHAPKFASPEAIPFSILLPAYVTSELKTAFQIGFLIFLPFLVIDLVVATTLMSLGMMMLSPTIISMPFKLLLFVLVDGWALTMGSLAQSFG
jgi:flagellar biosynthetic protein FliP